MHKVAGIGGFFFKSSDPAALSGWYRDALGIELPPQTYEGPVWRQREGVTIFAAFDEDSAMFGDGGGRWMLNFRVDDLDAMVAQLERLGVAVQVDPEIYPNGRFASLSDPEGNPLQIWQPMGPDAD